jgi:trehalose-phosphatase
MHRLNEQSDPIRFFDRLKAAASGVLMLDYDGTLAPFRPERELAIPYPGVRERLSQLMALPLTRLVLVSGRWSEDLIPLLGLQYLPEIWGCHGAERVLPDGSTQFVDLAPEAQAGLEQARRWALEHDLANHLEHKPTSVAFHWRGWAEDRIAAVRAKVNDRWRSAAEASGLELKQFDGGLELRVAGIDKGRAVREIVKETGDGVPMAYLGDDLTDEDAFKAMPPDGLKVLVGRELRDSVADLWLVPPEDLLLFLDRWIDTGA